MNEFPPREGLTGLVGDCGPCPYLPDRRFHAFQPVDMALAARHYRLLMDNGFRRTGHIFYRPMCEGCAACVPLRVAVATFAPRRDQRRAWGHNRDLSVTFAPRGSDAERADLYRRYQRTVHATEPVDEQGVGSLAESGGVPGGELHARDASGRLLAVSVIDLYDDVSSSVYCYYDPELPRRALGTYMLLAEVEFARSVGIDWIYLGFWVEGCQKMAYKARFGPHELLIDGGWRPAGVTAGSSR